ncbi:MAG: metal-dependent transcriptional regulator [Thermomicrobiales bacterium]|nr:metal-dependent transcriptional regulator [Thermomicrobiales bacterium]
MSSARNRTSRSQTAVSREPAVTTAIFKAGDDVVTITPAMEDYLKTIYRLSEDGQRVTTQAIAERLEVAAPSVTGMIKRLADLHLVDHQRYRSVQLTPAGQKAALEVVRHHRLLELYLAEALGYSWDEVHDEAERLEHTISEEFEARIDAALGYPTIDPHGDPIPSMSGSVPQVSNDRLSSLAVGDAGTISRVTDDDPDKLRYLGSIGLYPEVRIVLLERLPFGGPLRLDVNGEEHFLGAELADSIHILRDEPVNAS